MADTAPHRFVWNNPSTCCVVTLFFIMFICTGIQGGGGSVHIWQSFSPLVALISTFIHNFDIYIDGTY